MKTRIIKYRRMYIGAKIDNSEGYDEISHFVILDKNKKELNYKCTTYEEAKLLIDFETEEEKNYE